MKYNLTINLIFFIPVMKVLYIYTYKAVFDFKSMGLKLICKGTWVARDHAIWFSERWVIGSQLRGNFSLDFFVVGIGKNSLTAHSWTATTIANHFHPPSKPRASLLAQLRIGGRRQSRTRGRLGGGLLSQLRSEISMRRAWRGKSEGWGRR